MIRAELAIIGAGAAGLRVAQGYREAGGTGVVVLIGEEHHLPYDRPPLSKEILSGATAWSPLAAAEDLAAADIEHLASTSVTGLVPRHDGVGVFAAGTETCRARRVVLATGGRARRLPLEGADLEGVMALRTVDDALLLRDALTPGAHIVLLGAGFIGTEIAAAASKAGCVVSLVDVAERPLATQHRILSDLVSRLHLSNGVSLHLGVGVSRFIGRARVEQVELTDGRSLAADGVVVGIGLVPSVELAADAGIEVDDGVLVDTNYQTSMPGVFAVGDVARMRSGFLGRSMRVEHWQNAHDGGSSLGRHLATGEAPKHHVPWCWSDPYGVNIQIAGAPAPGDTVHVRGDETGNDFIAFFRGETSWTGVVSVNRPAECRAGMELLKSQAPLDPGVLRDLSAPLRPLIKRALAEAQL